MHGLLELHRVPAGADVELEELEEPYTKKVPSSLQEMFMRRNAMDGQAVICPGKVSNDGSSF